MAQDINQRVVVDVTANGADKAASSLEKLDASIKSILGNAKQLTSAMKSLNAALRKVSGKSAFTSLNAQLKKTEAQAKKTAAAVSRVSGYGIKNTGAAAIGSKTFEKRNVSELGTTIPVPTTPTVTTPSIPKETARATEEIGRASEKASKGMQQLDTNLKKTSKTAAKANTNFFRMRAILALIVGLSVAAFGALKKWFDSASDYAEAAHLYYTTLASSIRDVAEEEKNVTLHGRDLFGGVTSQSVQVTQAVADAEEELREFGDAMLLDPTPLRRTFATFYEMANAAGVLYTDAIKLSQGLTQLTYDLSSLWDVDFEDTANRLQGALSGVSTSVRRYGIDVSRTAADAWLLNNGFDTTYRQLDRANKMIVIYNMLMERTASSQGDLARSALQPANLFRILGQQASLAGKQLGATVFPIVTKLIPLFIMLAQAIQRAAAALSAFLGNKLGSWYKDAADQWSNYMSGLDTSFDFVDDDADDDLESINSGLGDTAKKLKEIRDFQLGFDELHVLPDMSDTGGGSGGGGTGGGVPGGISIPAVDPYEWEDFLSDTILKDAEKTLRQLKRLIDSIFGKGTWDAFIKATNMMVSSLTSNLGKVGAALGRLSKAFIDLFDWPKLLLGFAIGFDQVISAVADLTVWVLDLVTAFLGLDPIKDFFHDNSEAIGYFLGVLAGGLTVLAGGRIAFGLLGLALKPIAGFIKFAVAPLGTFLGLIKKVASPIGNVAKALMGGQGLTTAFGSLGGPIGTAAKLIKRFGKFLPALGGPVGIAITILSLLGTAFYELWQESDTFRQGVTDTFEDVKSHIQNAWKNIQPALDQLKDALVRIAEAFGLDVDGIEDLWDAFKVLLEPVLLSAIEQVGNIIKRFVTFVEIITKVVAPMIDYLSRLFSGLSKIFGGIGDVIVGVGKTIKGVVNDDFELVAEGARQVKAGTEKALDGIDEVISAPFETAKNTALGYVNDMRDGVEISFDEMGNIIVKEVDDAESGVSTAFDKIAKTVSGTNTSVEKDTKTKWSGISSGIRSTTSSLQTDTGTKFTNIKSSVGTSVGALQRDVLNKFDSIKNGSSTSFKSTQTNMVNPMNSAKTSVQNTTNTLATNLSTKFTGIQNTSKTRWNNVGNNMSNPVTSAKSKLFSVVDSIKNKFNQTISFPKIKLPHISWTSKDVFGVKIPTFSVNWYAKGGVFDEATLAGIGEAGPEAVVPLLGQRMKPFAQAVAMNIKSDDINTTHSYGQVTLSDRSVQVMAVAVANAISASMPTEIKAGDTYIDGTKVSDELDKNKRQRGISNAFAISSI